MRHKAFTLIELLVVVAVLGILMAMTFPALAWFQRKSARLNVEGLLGRVESALKAYHLDNNVAPVHPTFDKRIAGASIFVAGNPDHARAGAIMLYTELVSAALDEKGRPRPAYLVNEIKAVDLDSDNAIIDRYGMPLIYMSWVGTRNTAKQKNWPTNFPALAGNVNHWELWSSGPDTLYQDLRFTDSEDLDADNLAGGANMGLSAPGK